MSTQPNYDAETGIHYGVIPGNALHPAALDDIYTSGTDVGYENAQAEVKAQAFKLADLIDEALTEARKRIRESVAQYTSDYLDPKEQREFIVDNDLAPIGVSYDALWESLKTRWQEATQDADSGPYRYEQDGYILTTNSDGDVWVIKSPYYTECRECSPCAPNAGYLTDQPGSMKTYCLGAEWFEDDKPPYPIYSVTDGTLVTEGPKEEEDS